MTIKIRAFRTGGFEVDIRFTYPDGEPFRRRIKALVESRSAAKRWGEARERELFARPSPKALRDFAPRYVQGYARANKQKASEIHSKERIIALHLMPSLGDERLDALTEEDVQKLKAKLGNRKAKTINNVLLVLSGLLRTATKWKVLDHMLCSHLAMRGAPAEAIQELAGHTTSARRFGTCTCRRRRGRRRSPCSTIAELLERSWRRPSLDERI